MNTERQATFRETKPLTDGTRKVEANRHRRFQQYDIAMLRMMDMDTKLQELVDDYHNNHPDMEFRILRPLILPDDIRSNKYPDPEMRASFNIFFDFGDGVKKKSKNIGRECSRVGVMVMRRESFSPAALEIFGQNSEVLPLENVNKDLFGESINNAIHNPLIDIEPYFGDLDSVRPRIVDVNPYSRKFVKHF